MKDNLKLLSIAHGALSMVDDSQFDNDMFKDWLATAAGTLEALIMFSQLTDDAQGAKKAKKVKKKTKKK